jgi:hypothetical protein
MITLQTIAPGGDILPGLLPNWSSVLAELQAKAIQRVQAPLSLSGGTLSLQSYPLPPGWVLVQNTTDADLDRFAVVGLGSTVIHDPATELAAFQDAPLLYGDVPTVPDYVGYFAILQEAIPAGATGRAMAQGITAAQINVIKEGDLYADITDGDSTTLTSGASGAAQILAIQSGTGSKWGIVRLGSAPGSIPLGKPTAAWTTGATITLTPCDAAGVANGLANVTVQAGWTLPANTNIPTTAIIPYQMAADGKFYVLGQPRVVMTSFQYDTGTHTLQQKVRFDFGAFSTTESSAWVDITTAKDCTA